MERLPCDHVCPQVAFWQPVTLQGQREWGQALEQEALGHVLPARPSPKEEPGLTGVGILGNE